MSFGLLSSAWTWISGSSLGANLAKTAILAYGMSKLSDSMSKSDSGSSGEAEDTGARVQLNPDTSHKIPVLYGSAYFAGAITDVELTTDYKTMRYCISLCEKTGTKLSDSSTSEYTFHDVYINNNRVIFKEDGFTVDYTLDISGNQDISLRDIVKVYMYTEAPTQPEGYTGITPAATTVMNHWDASYTMTGLVYAIVEVTYNRAKNVTGIPECKFHMSNSMSLPGDCLYDYMSNAVYGAGIPTIEIDDSFAALNSYATTGFTYTLPDTTTTTSTYTINGMLDTDNKVLDNMEEIASNANSWISYDILEGKWTTVINKAESIKATLTDDNIVDSISIGSTSLSQLNSVAEVKFQNASILDKTDYVRVTIPGGDVLANEPETVLEVKLPFVNKQAVALKVGLQYLKQGRVDKTISFTTDYSYINLKAGDVIGITSDIYNYTNKAFRITDIEETDSEDGQILINFDCIEYSADVYSGDITEYTVETDDGLIGIGTIGVPGIVQYSKVERAARPRVTLESVSPSGVVEALEFWVTTETEVAESERTYRLLSTRYPTELITETWPEGTNVTYEDDTLSEGNFLIKSRGVNSIVVGPFSDPSGIIEYVPVQTTDAISEETGFFDSIGGLIGALTLFSLLNKMFEMFDETDTEESIFERIFNIFEEETGVDLVGDASDGSLVVAANLEIRGEGEAVTTITSAIDFVGDNVIVEAPSGGNVAKVTIVGNSIDDGVLEEDMLMWNGEKWVPVTITMIPDPNGSDCCIKQIDWNGQEPIVEVVVHQCYLEQVETWPVDRPTFYEDNTIEPILKVPNTGSYFIRYEFHHIDGHSEQVEPLNPGPGSAYLYLSDGTLVETLTSAQCIIHNDIVELPWATRVQGSDYYILLDEELVNYCDCISPEITQPLPWNFNVAPYDVEEYIIDVNVIPDDLSEFEDEWTHPEYTLTYSGSPSGTDICPSKFGNLILTFDENVAKLSGSVELYNLTDDVTVTSFDSSSASFTGEKMDFGDITSYIEVGKDYQVRVPKDMVRTARPVVVQEQEYCGNTYTDTWYPEQEYNKAFSFSFSLIIPLEIIEITGYTNRMSNRTDELVNLRTDLRIKYNRSGIKYGPEEPSTVRLFKADGTLIQTFELSDAFDPEYTSELRKIITTDEDDDTLLINPTHMLEPHETYYVLVDDGALWDKVCDVRHIGTNDTNLLRFTTHYIKMNEDLTQDPPNTKEPLNNIKVLIETDPTSTIAPSTGDINVYDDDENLVMTIPADSPAIVNSQG